jgi:hypothetical protein
MNETILIVIVVGVSVGGTYQLLRYDSAQRIIMLIAVSLLATYVFLGAAGWL